MRGEYGCAADRRVVESRQDGVRKQMTTQDIVTALRDSCFGERLSHEGLNRVASASKVVDFPTGHTVYREGETAPAIYVVVDGAVSIELKLQRREVRLLTVGPGELLGWSPILQHERLTATACTMSPTRAIEIDVAELLAFFDSDRRLGYDFMRATLSAMGTRLEATLLQLADIYGLSQPTASE